MDKEIQPLDIIEVGSAEEILEQYDGNHTKAFDAVAARTFSRVAELDLVAPWEMRILDNFFEEVAGVLSESAHPEAERLNGRLGVLVELWETGASKEIAPFGWEVVNKEGAVHIWRPQ